MSFELLLGLSFLGVGVVQMAQEQGVAYMEIFALQTLHGVGFRKVIALGGIFACRWPVRSVFLKENQ